MIVGVISIGIMIGNVYMYRPLKIGMNGRLVFSNHPSKVKVTHREMPKY